jgi:hypothetical protein
MKKILFLTALAFVAVAASFAFNQPKATIESQTLDPVMVWFQVDEDGQPIDESNGLAGSNPFSCQGGSTLCSRALTYVSGNPTASEVIDNNDGTFSIKAGVDISSSAYYDGTHLKP